MSLPSARASRPVGLARLTSPALLRAATTVAAGAASALAMPPFDAPAVLFLTVPVLVLCLDRALAKPASLPRRLARAAALGWLFGFGYFLAGLWWIGAAFLVDAGRFAALLPVAVAGLPAGLALFTAFGTALAALAWSPGLVRILALALGLGIAEWLRGHVLTGFPWNSLGYAATIDPRLMQAASLIGVEGLTPLVVFCAAAPAAFVGPPGNRCWRAGLVATALSVAILGGLGGWGAARLAAAPDPMPTVPGVFLRLVQPAIDQAQKWNAERARAQFQELITLSEAPGRDGERLRAGSIVIWPETAIPFFYEAHPDAQEAVAAMLPDGASLLAGGVHAEPGRTPDAPPRYTNSLLQIGSDGRVDARYDKNHLVPFGEFLPFQSILERIGLEQLTELAGGFTAGRGRVPLSVGNAPPALPLICYEVIFPGLARGLAPRPGWLVNITNDAWFGSTPGPYQHLQQARVRAVEDGLPLVRAANTGISAVLDPYGRTVASLPLGPEGAVDAPLPRALPATIYLRWLAPWSELILMILGFSLVYVGDMQLVKRRS